MVGGGSGRSTAVASALPYPRLTLIALAVLGAIALAITLALRAIGGLSAIALGTSALAMLLVLSNALVVIARPDGDKVQRTEARLRRWFKPPRRLRFTREGRYFVGITFGVGFAAINTGNNLLYLLLGMMLSLIIASGILSEMSLRGLVVERRAPARIHVGRPFLMGISVKNDKARLPSFSVEVEDLVDGKPLDKKCYFLKVPSGRRQQTSYRHTATRRGLHHFSGLRLSTKFPFALFRKSREVAAAEEVIVLPAIHPVAPPPAALSPTGGDEARARRGRHGDFHALREYRDGDDPRDVHWRSSARKGRAMVREHEDEAAKRVTLVIDNALPDGAGCTDGELLDALERAVALAASLAAHYLERGFVLRIVARGEQLGWGSGAAHLTRALRLLALLATVEESVPLPAPADRFGEVLWVARRGAGASSPTAARAGRVVEA